MMKSAKRDSRSLVPCVSALALSLAGGAAYADVIANFGGSNQYVTGNRAITISTDDAVEADFNGDGTLDVAYVDAYDDVTPLGFNDYSGPSLYGGMRAIVFDGAGRDASEDFGPRYIIRNSDNGDFFRAQFVPEGEDLDALLDVILVIQKEDFLNGGDTGQVVFDADSSIDLNVSGPGPIPTRFIVRDGDDYYISEQTLPKNGATWAGFATESSDGSWAEWDGTFDFDPGSADFQDRKFSDIEAIGVWIDPQNAGSGPILDFRSLTVNAAVTAIPEPASMALLSLGGLTLLRRRR